MKRLIKNITVISLVVGFSGCVQNKTVLNTPNIKTNIDTKSIKFGVNVKPTTHKIPP